VLLSSDFPNPPDAEETGNWSQGSDIAGEGYGLMGYVATLIEIGAKTASVLGKRWAAQEA